MKVLHLINTLSAGGAELHLLTLCHALRQKGVEMVVACLREHVKGSRSLRPEFEREGIRVVDLQAAWRYNWLFPIRFIRLTKQERPDILHTHLPRADFGGAVGHLLDPSIPWISSIHDIYSNSWSGKWALPLFNGMWRRADALIAISHAVKEWLIQERHIALEKVTMIHYGIELEAFTQPHADWRRARGLDGQAIIGSIGRLESRKGHDILIRAMPAVREQVPSAFLAIVGHDPWDYGKTLQTIIDKLGLKGHAQLIGFQSDVPSFLHALDLFAFASRSEGFGQVVIEAMAAGKPVVASKIPPLTEIVVDGETGLLVEPNNPAAFAEALVWLCRHPDEAQQMGMRAQARVQHHFSVDKMSEAVLLLYQRVIETGGSRM